MNRRFSLPASLLAAVLLSLTACSVGGINSHPAVNTPATPSPSPSPTATATPVVASLTLSLQGGPLQNGFAGDYTVSLVAKDPSGNVISGSLAAPVIITSSDIADIGLSTTGGSSSGSGYVSVASPSTTPIVLAYDGKNLTAPTLTATYGSISTTDLLTTTQPSSPTNTTTYSKVSISLVNYASTTAIPGTAQVNISVYDSNGNVVGGSYSPPIVVTINDAEDYELTTSAGSAPPSACTTSPCPLYPISAVLSSSSNPLYLGYTGTHHAASGTETISASIPGGPSTSVPLN